jgi:DNA-binding NarL/FixJ family response regulator
VTTTADITAARVVVADDDVGVREAMCEILERWGFAVVGRASDGAEAVTFTTDTSPDVVLMDQRMPGVDGIEASRQIKDRFPSTQVIVLSAYDDESLRDLADDAGVYCYLIKGCPPALILDMVRRAIDFKHQLDNRAVRDR